MPKPLDQETREQLSRVLVGMPLGEARAMLSGLSPEAIARAVGGLPIQAGTEALIKQALGQSGPPAILSAGPSNGKTSARDVREAVACDERSFGDGDAT